MISSATTYAHYPIVMYSHISMMFGFRSDDEEEELGDEEDATLDDDILDELADDEVADADDPLAEGFGEMPAEEEEAIEKASEEREGEDDGEVLEDDAEDVDYDTFDDVDEM
jgi:hypothetical protein